MEGIHKTYNFLYQKNRCQLAFIEQKMPLFWYLNFGWLTNNDLLSVTLHCYYDNSDYAVPVWLIVAFFLRKGDWNCLKAALSPLLRGIARGQTFLKYITTYSQRKKNVRFGSKF